jgi:hypothetical protein
MFDDNNDDDDDAQSWLNGNRQLLVLFLVRTRSSWLHHAIWKIYPALREGDAVERETTSDRRRIEGPYRDEPTLENDVNEEHASETETITHLNHSTNNRHESQGPMMQPSRLIEGDNAWRDEAH